MKKILIFFNFFLLFSCKHLTDPFGAGMDKISDSVTDTIIVNEMVYEDFDGGGIGTSWANFDDRLNNGNSYSTQFSITGYSGSGVRLQYQLGPDYVSRYAFLSIVSPVDISKYNAVQFKMKGSGNKVRVILRADTFQNSNAPSPSSYDDYGYVIGNSSSSWKEYTIFFKDFVQEGWGAKFNLDDILVNFDRIQFKAASMISGETGFFDVDDVKFVYLQKKR